MKFPFLFKATEITITATTTATSTALSWPWPSCTTNPKTPSFRANTTTNTYKTINSADLDETNTTQIAENDSFFSISKPFKHFHEESELESSVHVQPYNVETAVISGLMSDRLFFEPGETSSILEDSTLEEAKTQDYKASVAIMEMDSNDPFLDFRVSMEEMVEAHGLKEWEYLEELLECYLRVNNKRNHGYIVGAFVDLLIRLSLISASKDCAVDENCSSSSTTTQYSFSSPLSFCSSTYSSTSPCLSLLEKEDELFVVEKNGDSSLLFNASSSGVI